MTKEEILEDNNLSGLSEATIGIEMDNIEKAMDQWAKEVAIDYAHYILGKMFPYMVNGGAPNPEAEKLFDKYQQEKSSI